METFDFEKLVEAVRGSRLALLWWELSVSGSAVASAN